MIAAAVLLLSAWLLLLIVSLSVPIIDNVQLFTLDLNVDSGLFRSGVSQGVSFGLWGYCTDGQETTVFGQTRRSAGECSETRAGYEFDSSLLRLLRLDDDLALLSRTLTAALVLHPIACGFAFLAFIFSLIFLVRKKRLNATGYGWQGLTLIATLAALGLGLVAFIIDITLIATLRNRVRDVSDESIVVNFGNAVWIALAAVVALALAAGATCFSFISTRRARRAKTTY